jgi:hypothetical protein
MAGASILNLLEGNFFVESCLWITCTAGLEPTVGRARTT